jgi:hypothetical protein
MAAIFFFAIHFDAVILRCAVKLVIKATNAIAPVTNPTVETVVSNPYCWLPLRWYTLPRSSNPEGGSLGLSSFLSSGKGAIVEWCTATILEDEDDGEAVVKKLRREFVRL